MQRRLYGHDPRHLAEVKPKGAAGALRYEELPVRVEEGPRRQQGLYLVGEEESEVREEDFGRVVLRSEGRER